LKHLLLILAIVISFLSEAQISAYDIFKKSYRKISHATTMQYYNISKERIEGEYLKDKTLVKVNRLPFKVYLSQEKEGGSEILYNAAINQQKAIISPGKFPYITLYLSPYGRIMRNKTHHTLFQADIKYTYDILQHAVVHRKNDDLMSLIGKYKIGDKIVYKLQIANKNWKIYKYTVKKGENLTSIAKDHRIGDYKILELNPNISFYNDVDAGDIIYLPNYYSKSIILYIDVKTFLPYMLKVYDEKDLYESYIFKNLILNCPFSKGEFLESYKDYSF